MHIYIKLVNTTLECDICDVPETVEHYIIHCKNEPAKAIKATCNTCDIQHMLNKKLSYRRETARQLPTLRGLSPPVHSTSPSGNTYAYGRIRNPQQMYVKRAVRKVHFKLNPAFKVILICADRNPERCIVVMSN